MRIDPSQLSEPLAHILGAGAVDAATGEKAASQARGLRDPQLESLDHLLLRRLQLHQTQRAADSVVSFQDALARVDRVAELAQHTAGGVASAHGSLDPARVRGLLGH